MLGPARPHCIISLVLCMTASALLFVYGSLRRGSGHARSLWLEQSAVWQGPASLSGDLYRVSWYPALVTGSRIVRGDVYRLPAALLAELDIYEAIRQQPDDEYRRSIGLVTLAQGVKCEAFIYWYVQSVQGLEKVQGGDWLQYVGNRDSGVVPQ
jgi:gamma-glutamylcyclotransferase (GGCT)/AIG2-like uncharacterized protein YtfP